MYQFCAAFLVRQGFSGGHANPAQSPASSAHPPFRQFGRVPQACANCTTRVSISLCVHACVRAYVRAGVVVVVMAHHDDHHETLI